MNKKIKSITGTSLLFFGIGGFFFLMHILGIWGTSIKGADLSYMFKSTIPWLFMFGCVYLSIWMHSDEKSARIQTLFLCLPLFVAMIIGYLSWGANTL